MPKIFYAFCTKAWFSFLQFSYLIVVNNSCCLRPKEENYWKIHFMLNTFEWNNLFCPALVGIFVLAVIPTKDRLSGLFSLGDIINHFLAFIALSILIDFSYRRMRIKDEILVLALYGFFIEVIQYFLPYRHFSWVDYLTDVSAILAYFFFIRNIFRPRLTQRLWKRNTTFIRAKI